MPAKPAGRRWETGSLRRAALLLAVGLLVAGNVCRGQQVDCSTIVDNVDGSRAVLTKRALDRADNNFQAIIDCIPEGTSLMLDLPSVHPNHTIVLERPIRIGSISGIKTEFKCPPGGLLDIRSGAVQISDISARGCDLGHVIEVSRCPGPSPKVTISSSDVYNNKATNGSGIISVARGCNLLLDDVRVAQNQGGALVLHKKAQATLSNCVFVNNSELGAVVMRDGAALSAENSRFIGNVANEFGGALNSTGNNLIQLRSCTFERNNATTGGAINAQTNSTVMATDCTFEENYAIATGGAVYLEDSSTLNATGCTFLKNYADDRAGALRAQDRCAITMKNCTITENKAKLYGGAILVVKSSKLDADNCTFLRNAGPPEGGAICAVLVFDMKITRSVFIGNTATDRNGFGGAVYAKGAYDLYDEGKVSNMTISDSIFLRNVAGPPLRVADGPPTVATEHGWGGAIFLGSSSLVGDGSPFVSPRGHLIVKIGPNVEFIENTATRGAAIASISTTTLSVESADFVGNVALEGAAMFLQTDGDHEPRVHVDPPHYTEVSLSTFHGNIASSGGALFLRVSLATAPLRRGGISPKGVSRFTPTGLNNNEDDIFFEQCSFTDNMCVVSGGAVYSEAGRVGCKDCVFDGNGVVESNDVGCGGALALTQQAALHARNVTFTGNTAAFGGAVHAVNSLVDLIDADVASNAATVDGGGLNIEIPSTTIFKHNVVGRVANSTVRGNKAKNGGGINFKMVVPQSAEKVEGSEAMQKNETTIETALVSSTREVEANEHEALLSRFFAVSKTEFLDNVAETTGGAVYTDRPESVDVCCDCELEVDEQIGIDGSTSQAANDSELIRTGIYGVTRSNPPGVTHRPHPCKQTWARNRAEGESGAGHIATIATDRRVCSAQGECVTGAGVLHVRGHESGEAMEPISVTFTDVYNRPTVLESGTFIRVTANGENAVVTGPAMEPTTAAFIIDGVTVFAYVGQVHNLTMSFPPSSLPAVVVQVDVRDCRAGEQVKAHGSLCEECADGLYNFEAGVSSCTLCKPNAQCRGATIVPFDRFWHSTSKSTQIHRCITRRSCEGTGRDIERMKLEAHAAHKEGALLMYDDERYPQCSEGYHGVLCGACDETHGKVEPGKCNLCGSRRHQRLLLGALALWYITLAAVLAKGATTAVVDTTYDQKPKPPKEGPLPETMKDVNCEDTGKPKDAKISYAPEIFKIVINFLQITAIAATINFDWTSSVAHAIGAADVLASSGENVVAFQCAFSAGGPIPRSILQIIVSLLFPFVLMLILTAAWGVAAAVKRTPCTRLMSQWGTIILVVLHLSYIHITRNVLKISVCTTVDKEDIDPPENAIARDRYWAVDTDLQCWEGQHLLLQLSAGVPLLILVSVGMPALLLVFLYRKDFSSKGEREVAYSFLCQGYRPGCRYWEVMILIRKALMATISVYSFSLGPDLQAVLALGVLASALVGHLVMKPFVADGPGLNRLETISLSVSFFVFLVGLVLNDPHTTQRVEILVSVVAVMALMGSAIFMIYQLACEVFKCLRAALESLMRNVGKVTAVVNLVFGLCQSKPRWSLSVVVRDIEGSTASPAVSEASVQDEATCANLKDGPGDNLDSSKRSMMVGIVHADVDKDRTAI